MMMEVSNKSGSRKVSMFRPNLEIRVSAPKTTCQSVKPDDLPGNPKKQRDTLVSKRIGKRRGWMVSTHHNNRQPWYTPRLRKTTKFTPRCILSTLHFFDPAGKENATKGKAHILPLFQPYGTVDYSNINTPSLPHKRRYRFCPSCSPCRALFILRIIPKQGHRFQLGSPVEIRSCQANCRLYRPNRAYCRLLLRAVCFPWACTDFSQDDCSLISASMAHGIRT